MPANAFSPQRSESGKCSVCMLQVPSWPEHSCTASTSIGDELEQIAAADADVLHADVTGHVVLDAAEAAL